MGNSPSMPPDPSEPRDRPGFTVPDIHEKFHRPTNNALDALSRPASKIPCVHFHLSKIKNKKIHLGDDLYQIMCKIRLSIS